MQAGVGQLLKNPRHLESSSNMYDSNTFFPQHSKYISLPT